MTSQEELAEIKKNAICEKKWCLQWLLSGGQADVVNPDELIECAMLRFMEEEGLDAEKDSQPIPQSKISEQTKDTALTRRQI